MTVVYSTLAFVTAPSEYVVVPQTRPSMALSAGKSGSFGDWLNSAFAKSSSAQEGWPGNEVDLKTEKVSGRSKTSKPASRVGTAASKKGGESKKGGLFGFGK